jgi:predicted NAD-dependent protein-ADP-ribosyltransferase YbiA (DUF1768 family)
MAKPNPDPINQNTNPIDINKFAEQYQQGTLEGQQYYASMPELITTGSEKTFAEITAEQQYEDTVKNLETEVVAEDYDNLLTGAGKLVGQIFYNVGAMIGDVLGTITDPGDWRIGLTPPDWLWKGLVSTEGMDEDEEYRNPLVEEYKPVLEENINNAFKFIDNNIWGDGEYETGNMWTRSAANLRAKSQHFYQINTSSDWFDTGINFVVPIVSSVLGAARTGNVTAVAGELAGLSQTANAIVNAFIMTESTGLSIAQDVHTDVYGEVLDKLSKGELGKLEETAKQQAMQKAMEEGYNLKDAKWLGMEAAKQARKDFALANPDLSKQAFKNAAYGADIALKSMTPAFALNLVTANMYTRSLYSPKNILSKPTWVNAKDFYKETRNEIIEEAFIENIAEKKGIAYGTKGSYNYNDLYNTIVSYDTLYSAIGAVIGGGGSTVFSSIPIVGDFKERKKQYEEQQEVLQKQNKIGNVAGLKDMIDKATTLTMDLEQITKLGKEAAILEQMGMKEEANMLKDKMLAIQAHEAFESGTTKNLVENYEKIATNPNAGPEVQMRAREAIAEIKQMGEVYQKTKGKFLNDQEVYGNKINEQNLNKIEKQLETEIIQKRLEADAAIKLELEAGKTSLTSEEETIIDNETGKVVSTEQSQLGYNIANLKVNPFASNTKNAEIYRNFSEHVTNNVQAVRELNELEQRLEGVKEIKKQNFERYNKITSKAYQKSLRYEQKLARVFNAGGKELEELKGTSQYMPLVDAIMEKYKGKIDEKQFNSIRKYFENQNNTKKAAEDIAKEEIKKNEFAKSDEETDVEETSTIETTNEAPAVKPEGTKAMLENVANKLASGQSIKNLTPDEQQFYMNNNEVVDKRKSEIQSGGSNKTQSEINEDEEISVETQEIINQVSTELDDIMKSTTPEEKQGEVKPMSKNEVKDVLETSSSAIAALEEERLTQFNLAKEGSIKRIQQSTDPQVIFSEINRLQEALKATKGSSLSKEEQTLIDKKLKELQDQGYTFKTARGKIINSNDTSIVIDENVVYIDNTNVTEEDKKLIRQELERRNKLKQKLIENGYTEEEAIIQSGLDSDATIDIASRDITVSVWKDGKLQKAGRVKERFINIKDVTSILEESNAEIAALEGKPVTQESNVVQEIEKFINRIIPNQEKRLINAQEIASNGKTFNEAINNLIKKSENARNKANERLKKEAAKEGVKPLDIQERLDEYKETKEADRYDYLIEQINEVYAVKTENFNNPTQEAIDFEQGQLDIANKRLAALKGKPTVEQKPVVEQKQTTLSQKEQEILNSFKDNKASKPLLNRKFAANKSEIESLLAKGIIKEDGNNYVIAGREAQEVTLTVEKTKAEQVADNLLAKQFTRNAEGTYNLQINLKALSPEEKADIEDAVKVIKERIKNNQLDGWEINKQSNPLFEVVTITKPNLTSNQPMEEGDVSYQPDEVPTLTKEQEEKIKDLIESYVNTMEIDNNKFPTFEELVKSYIRTVGKEKAEKHLKLLGTGWELNGYGTISDYNAILKKLFGKREDIALGISAMSEELSQSVGAPKEVEVKQDELIKIEEIKDSAEPIDVTPDKQVVYSTETDIVSDTSPKLGFSVFDFSISQTVRDKDGKIIVTTDTINEGLKKKLDKDKLVKAIKTANFENVKVGAKLTVSVNPLNELNRVKSWVIPARVEDKNDPLYGTDVLEEKIIDGKKVKTVKTIKFGDWLDQKVEESGLSVEEFIETQEFWDRVPILVSDEQGDFIGQIRDIGWYTATKFNGDIKEAKRNVNEIRKLIKEAFKRGENSVFEITNITGGKTDGLKLTELVPLKKANPQAMMGLIVKDKDGNFQTFIYENGKRKEVKVENLSVITGAEQNKTKSMMKVDIRRWGTDADGNPTYKAFYSTSPKLSASQVNTVKNIIYSKLIVANNNLSTSQNNKFGKLLNAINSTIGSDITNNESFTDLLKRFVFISPVKNISQEYRQGLINKVNEGNISEVENTLANSYFKNINKLEPGQTTILSLAPDILVVAKNGTNGIEVKIINKNTIPVENNEIVNNQEFLQRDALLQEALQNSLLNGYNQVANYKQPVIQVNNDFTLTTVANSYPEFVQNNVLTNLMSINVGTNDKPVYATRLQSNIYYKPVGTAPGKSVSRKEGQTMVSDSKVTEKDKQAITNVVESTSDEAFEEAVEGVEQDGFELFGDTVEEKAEDLKEVVKQMSNESKEIVENHLEAKPNLDDLSEYNEFLNQASNKIKWVNEYFNEDNTESAESLESNQPREIGEEDVEDMAINLLRINGVSSRHQSQLANYASVKLGDILSTKEINQQEVRDKVVEDITNTLNANKEALQETLAQLKSIPQYEDRPKVMALVVKYETALNKINLVLDNIDVIYKQSVAIALKDLNGKIIENDEIEVGDDPNDNDLDNQENEEDVDDELSEEEDRHLGTENYSKTSLEVNPKASITSTLRRFMRGIPDISPTTGLPKSGAMGVTTYVDFDTVYDVVQSLLADAPVDFNMMMDILEVNKNKQPWLPILINKLKESSSEVKNQFTTTMGKHALTMEFLMYSFDKEGNVTFKIVNTNLSSINRKIKDEWSNNLTSSNVLIDEYGNVSRDTVDELLNEYNSWMKTPSVLSSGHQRFIKERLKLGETSFNADENNKTLNISVELAQQKTNSKITNIDGKEYLVSIGNADVITVTPYERNIVSKALVDYASLTPAESKEAIEKIKDWFDAFGIELTDNAIDGLFKNPKVSASQFFEQSNNFAVGSLVKWLDTTRKAFSQDKEVTITEGSKNNPLDNSAVSDLAYHQSKYSSGIVTSSFRDGKKSIYGFTAFKFITDRANEIKNKPEFRDNLRKLSFSKNSFWLQLFEDGIDLPVYNFKERFNVTHLGLTALKEFAKKLYRDNGITALGDVDHELVKVGMHQADQGALSKPFTVFGQQISLRNITALFPTMSDKSTMTLVKTLGLNLTDKKYFDKTENGKLVPNKSIAEFIFEQTVLPEIERVINFNAKNPNGTDIKNYDKGAKMLLLMPHLNDLVIFEQDGKKITLNEAINTKNADLQKVLAKKDVILTEVQNYVSALVEEKMKVWAANGYYTVEEKDGKTKVTNNLLDKKYMEGVVADSQLEKIELAAMDFEINQMLSNANAFMTMIGDPAIYYKADSSKSFIQQSKETFTNVGKRLALMIAPGSKLADSETEQYTQVMLNDRVAMSENISFLTEVLDNKKFDWKEYNRIKSLNTKSDDPVKAKELKDEQKKQFEEFYDKYPNSNGYFNIEGTDAQEYTTWQEHLHILEKLGRLNDATVSITPEEIREAKEMFANNTPYSQMSDKQKGILKKVLQPIKPVYTGQILDEAQDVMRTVYIKSSSFPLIPQVTEGTELNKLKEALEALQKEGAGPNPSPYKYVRASYQSANKVGAKAKALSMYEDDGSIKDLKVEDLKASSLTLNRKDFKIQLDVPYKSFKKKEDTVSLGTQLNKILFGNGIMDAEGFMLDGEPISGVELEKKYTKAFIDLVNYKTQQLYDELGIDIKTNKPIDVRATAAKLQNILKTEAINRGYSKQDVEALEVIIKEVNGEEDLTFKLPLWLAANANRFESLLNAVVNNRIVKLKFPGSSFVAGSEEGFKIQKDFKGVDKNKIVWTKNWNGKELQAAKYDADGNLQYAQVIAPSKFRKKDGTLIDLLERKNNKYVYVTETTQGFKLKEDMIDPELRNITAFRIPTSGHMSAAQVEIVGFLPNEQGDLMIVPRNLTKQKGLDFDVDKENTYSLWHETDENGKITVLKEGDKEKLLQNEIIKIHTAVLSNPDKEVQKKINNILSIDYAKEQAENIDNMISSSKDETYFTPLGSEYQKNKMFLGASGKIGIGAYSLDVTTHSLFEQAKAKGNQVSLNYTDIDERGKTIPHAFNMSFEGEGRTDGTLGNQQTIDGQRTIAQVLSELQNIATDNEKEQVMGRVNLNSYTLDVSKILAMLGFDKAKNGNSIQFTFLSQPIIREYVKEMDNVNSNVAKFNPNKESAVINKLLEKYGNPRYELGYDVDVQNTKNFTMDKMENQLRGEVDNNFQLAVLNRFLELKKLGLAVRTLQGAINTDSKGLGKSILDNSQKIESINNLLSNPVITNAGELLGNFIPIVKYEKGKRIKALSDAEYQSYINDGYVKFGDNLFLPTTVNGVFTARALVTATSLWDRHFPYNSKLFNSIFENLMPLISKSEASDAKKVEKKSMVIKEIKRFLNSYSASNTLFDNINAQAERERLFFDRPSTGKVSLATYIKELKKANSSLASNKLIERLELVANTQGEPSLIKFNNTSAGFYDENGLNNALLELMELNLNLPSFNGEAYTSRKLAQDLITYSYLEGGVQEATQFVKFIPLAYLNKMGFTFGLSNIDFDSMGAYAIFGISPDGDIESKFITQFAQHNPGILPKLDNYIPKIGDIKNISEVTEFNIEKMLNAIEYQGMTAAEFYQSNGMDAKQIEEFKIALANKVSNFSMPEFVALRKDGEYLLWKSAGNGNYVQVPVVQSGISEYDSNVQQITPLSSEIVTPQNPVKEQPLSPSSDESKVTNETRFGLGTDASLTDIVTNLANSTGIDEYLVTLAKQLLSAIDPTTSITVDNIKTKGKYKRAENAIIISASQAKNATDTELARTILKELMHSITDNELGKHVYRSSGDNKYYLKSNDAPKHISVLINLFNQVSKIPEFENAMESIRKKLEIKGQEQALTPEENRIYYGAYDVYEFVEMMMTQPEFQQEMAKIKTGNGKSVLDLFKNFLNSLFKNLGIQFETGTVASEAIENILILVDEKGRLKQPTQAQPTTERKTYSGKVTSLKPNQIFVFGSNPLGINGNPSKGTGGAALVAYNIAGVKQGEKMDNKLSDSGKAWGMTTVTSPGKKRSKTPQEITEGIKKLYEYAKQNPTKEFLISDYSGTNLNGYSGQEMADMFVNAGTIPSNIVFNENFDKLIPTQPTTSQGFQGYKGGFDNTGKGTPEGDGKDKAMRAVADGFIGEVDSSKRNTSTSTSAIEIEKKSGNNNPQVAIYEKGDNQNSVANGNTNSAKIIMLARNGSLNNKSLLQETKDNIKYLASKGAEFVVGDMPGVDSQFIEYLQEIGAKFTVYHTGNTPRITISKPEVKPTTTSSLPGPETKINIYAGTGENAELSNFANRPFKDDGILDLGLNYKDATEKNITFNTVEGFFQAHKIQSSDSSEYWNKENEGWELTPKAIALIEQLAKATGAEAKALGRTIKELDTKEWDIEASRVMKDGLYYSFEQNPDALAKLLATGNATLTHTQDKGKWGTEFPKLLMEVREELKSQQPTTTTQPTNEVVNNITTQLNKSKDLNNTLDLLESQGYVIKNNNSTLFDLGEGRDAILFNINGTIIPVYRSSQGTSSKTKGEWYPFFFNTNDWVVKGMADTYKEGYNNPIIKQLLDSLNKNYKYDKPKSKINVNNRELLNNFTTDNFNFNNNGVYDFQNYYLSAMILKSWQENLGNIDVSGYEKYINNIASNLKQSNPNLSNKIDAAANTVLNLFNEIQTTTTQPIVTQEIQMPKPTGVFTERLNEIRKIYSGNKSYINTNVSGAEAWEQINAQQGNVTPEDIYNIKDEIGGNLFEYFNKAYQYITGNKLVQDKNFVIPINQSSKPTTQPSTEVKIESGRYVKYQGETYIVTKINDNGTIQIYNPNKEGTDAKKSVAERNLEVTTNKGNIVSYREAEYIVTPKGTIISLTSNKIMKWGEESGDRKAILALAQQEVKPTPTVSNSIKEFMELYFESQIDKAKLEQVPIPLSEEFKSRLTERIIAFDKQNLDVPIVRLGINFDNEFSDLANLPNNIQNSLKKELAKIITPIEKENKVKNKDFYYTRISQRLLGAGVQEKISSLKYDKDYLSKLIDIIITTKNLSESEISRQLKLSNDATHRLLVKASQLGIVSKTEPFKLLITSFEQLKNKFKLEGFVIQESTVSNSIKNDLLNILEDIKRETDDESLNDNLKFPVVNASEFSGYPNIQKYLNTEYGIEQREYEFFKLHKDVVEDLLSSMKEINPTNLLEKLKAITDTNDTGVDSNIKPIISADTKKDQELIKKANEQIKNTKYELFPGVGANVKQTEALDKLTDFLKAPIDKSEKTQSTFVLVGRGGTGKTTIVKKIVDEFPGKIVVGAAVSHTAKNNLKKSLKGKTVKTISAVTGLENKNTIRDKFNDTTLERADVIIIDECSMIDTATMNRIYELANPNAKIIFMGDNVQLPPIKEKSSPTFDAATKPEYNAKLTERMRQGEDSPIVPLSDIVAENIERSEKEIERKVIKRRDSNFNPITNKGVIFTDNNAELMSNLERDFKADVQNTKIITYTNDEGKTNAPGNKEEMNGVVRKILWGADAKNEYNVGEILVADNIIYDANILNGEYYEVQGIKPINDAVTITDIELVTGKGVVQKVKTFPGYALKVKVISETDNFNKIITLNLPSADSKEKINEIQKRLETAKQSLFIQNKKIIPDVNYGYAITSHKAQGSTFNNAYVMEDNIINSGMSNKEANQALYVAMTRPRNKLVMFSELKEGEFLTEKQKENMVPTGESLQPEEITSVEEKTQKNTVSSAIENQIEELIKKGIIKSKCD